MVEGRYKATIERKKGKEKEDRMKFMERLGIKSFNFSFYINIFYLPNKCKKECSGSIIFHGQKELNQKQNNKCNPYFIQTK